MPLFTVPHRGRIALNKLRRSNRSLRFALESLETRQVFASDSTVVINELMYNPADEAETLEFIELYNQLSYDMDVSNWSLGGGVEYTFPAGTTIGRGGYLVVAKSPADLASSAGITGVLGPWTGALSNGGETVSLINNSGRVMDEVDYKDSGAWPIGADGSGASLSKIDQNANGETARAWSSSVQVGGTPGDRNFGTTRYTTLIKEQLISEGAAARAHVPTSGALGLTWTGGSEPFADSSWRDGLTGVGYDVAGDYDSRIGLDIEAEMLGQNGSAYIRVPFNVSHPESLESLSLGLSYDDGAVVYLNGQEVLRRNVAEPPSLRGYYRLGEDDPGAADALVGDATTVAAGAGANLTRVGSPAYTSATRSAVSTLAMDLEDDDGGDLYWTDQIPLPAGTTDNFFLEAWVRPEQFDAFDFVASIGRATNGGVGLLQEGGRWKIIHNGVQISAAGPVPVLNQWTHLALVRDSGVSTLYVNGVASVTLTSVPSAPTDRFIIGGNAISAGFEGHFDGQIDDVRVFTFLPGTFDISMTLANDPPGPIEGGLSWNSNARTDRPDEEVTNSETISLDGSMDLLRSGENILAIHGLNSAPNDADFLIAPTLTTTRRAEIPQLLFTEISAGAGEGFFVELQNQGTDAVDLTGLVLRGTSVAGQRYVFGNGSLEPGEFVAIDASQLGFIPVDGDRLFVYSADESEVLAGQLVDDVLRGVSPEHGARWLFPVSASPGAANTFQLESDIVINEIMYQGAPTLPTPGVPAEYATSTLLGWDATWRYNQAGQGAGAAGLLPPDWATQSHPVPGSPGWAAGPGILAHETTAATLAIFPAPIGTAPPAIAVSNTKTTFYFETEFTVPVDTADGFEIQLQHLVDDGAIFYLNGVEILDRYNMPAGPVTNTTLASTAIEASLSAPATISAAQLAAAGFQKGVPQRLSVEVHQGGSVASSDVIFGAQVTLRTLTAPTVPGTPYVENPEEWIELFNRSETRAISLSGWELEEAINFTFPPGTILGPGEYLVIAKDPVSVQANYGITGVLGPYAGTLGNGGDRIELNDARRNPADEVQYFDGGSWDGFADGYGASLELRDPRADNSVGESWSASDEAARVTNEWQTITYRGTVESPLNTLGGNVDRFHEFILGLFGAGELLLDDVEVRRDPDGANVNVLQNSTFESGATAWRLQGTHGRSEVIVDPENSANRVLRVVATGPQEYYHNHLETTFASGNTIQPGQEYEISYRVKWLRGSNQVNTRLYFDHLAQTTNLSVPLEGGTPGRVNSVRQLNIGPTYEQLEHSPVVPAPNEPVTVSILANDPDSIATMTLFWRVDGGAFAGVPMTRMAGDQFAGQIPGLAAGTIVQFYVQGTDSRGESSYFPTGGGTALPVEGPDSRALYIVRDGLAATDGRNNFRLIVPQSDLNQLFVTANRMSNERIGATVIFNETEVYYNVGVRLKGSTRGRATDFGPAHGFNLQFGADQLFRGAHETIAVDRSNRSPSSPNGVDEILAMHIINHAGNIPGMYNDIINLNVASRPQDNGSAILMMARYDDLFLDSQFEDGGDGTLFEWDTLFVADLNGMATPESPKPPFPSTSFQTELNDKGDSKERYRAPFLIKNNRRQDDYDAIIAMNKVMGISGSANGGTLDVQSHEVLDVDQWMRTFALYRLIGIDDTYTSNNNHNIAFYVRPEDGKVLAFPQDLDWVFSPTNVPATAPLQRGGTNLDRLINIPNNRHYYLGHMHDIVTTTFNSPYMVPWLAHYSAVVPEQNFQGAAYAGYIAARSASVLNQMPAAVAFDITSPDITVPSSTIDIEGRGWINVRELRRSGQPVPLDVTWTNETTWQATVPLFEGETSVTIEAYDFQGVLIGTDVIGVQSTAVTPIRVTEVMYHPRSSGVNYLGRPEVSRDRDDYEFIELRNVSATETIALEGYRFSDGIDFTFPAQNLGPGEYVIVVANAAAFVERYGEGYPIAGEYAQNLSNGGETVAISGPAGNVVQSFTYGDDWLMETDGGGRSLVIVDDLLDATAWDLAESWRASRLRDGSPGGVDGLLGDFNGDDQLDTADIDALMARIAAGDDLGSFDLTRDDRVDLDDRDAWLVSAGTLNQLAAVPYALGDANLDGSVDAEDFNLWNQHRFSAVTQWSQGNFNGDQGVDGRDFNLWNERKYVAPSTAQAAVPTRRIPKSAATVRQPMIRHEEDKKETSAPHELGERDVMACTNVDVTMDVAVKVPKARR